jgi:hypothetical protein
MQEHILHIHDRPRSGHVQEDFPMIVKSWLAGLAALGAAAVGLAMTAAPAASASGSCRTRLW